MVYDNVVIGSSISALGCITGLVESSKKVLCIDGSDNIAEEKRQKLSIGSLIKYIDEGHQNNGKLAIVNKIIKHPKEMEAWNKNMRSPPKGEDLYEIKFLGVDFERDVKMITKITLFIISGRGVLEEYNH